MEKKANTWFGVKYNTNKELNFTKNYSAIRILPLVVFGKITAEINNISHDLGQILPTNIKINKVSEHQYVVEITFKEN